MTIKQAAMWLCQPGIVSMIHDPTTKKALNVAVKALAKSELGTNLAEVGTDCISRQQVIEALRTCYDTETITMDNGDEYINYCDAVGEIEQLPPIQPKRGRWHYSDGKPARIGLSFGVICDQCGTESEYCTNFCGECGADMREVNNEGN